MKGAHVKAFSGHLNVQVRNDICMFASTTVFNFHPLLQDLHLYPYLLFFSGLDARRTRFFRSSKVYSFSFAGSVAL